MKVWWFSLVGLFIFIAFALGVQFYLQKSADRLDNQLTGAETALHSGQWQKSLSNLQLLRKTWLKTKPTWAILFRHQEIDSIDQSLVKAEQALEAKSHPDARKELGSLKQLLEHIPERERFNLVNMF